MAAASQQSQSHRTTKKAITLRVDENDSRFWDFITAQQNTSLSIEMAVHVLVRDYPQLAEADMIAELPYLSAPDRAVTHQAPTQPSTFDVSANADGIDGADDSNADYSNTSTDVSSTTQHEPSPEKNNAPAVKQQARSQQAQPDTADARLALMRDEAAKNPNDDVMAGIMNM
jgi:hypothetical protein